MTIKELLIEADAIQVGVTESDWQKVIQLADSPLVDHGNPEQENDERTARCTHVDQRGHDRPAGAPVDGRVRCDIGAVERN